ncbi:hypothetical protein [Paraburkholderia fungorum]|uniref:hypothetical protein n=1 Tax=Paraburkholderia fungorum TaxID=134537 RepID=UPI0038BDE9A6
MKKWLDLNVFLRVPATAWLYAVVTMIACYSVLTILLRFVMARVEALAGRISMKLDDMIVKVLKSTRRATILISRSASKSYIT